MAEKLDEKEIVSFNEAFMSQMILLDATRTSEDALNARALFAERVAEKSHSHWSWQGYSQTLQMLGEDGPVREAAAKARALEHGR